MPDVLSEVQHAASTSSCCCVLWEHGIITGKRGQVGILGARMGGGRGVSITEGLGMGTGKLHRGVGTDKMTR